MSGRKYLSPTVGQLIVDDLSEAASDTPHKTLSDREFQVMRLLAKGKTLLEISEELSLSVKTISTYRVRIFEKMNLRTNAELTMYAVRYGLVE